MDVKNITRVQKKKATSRAILFAVSARIFLTVSGANYENLIFLWQMRVIIFFAVSGANYKKI